MAARVIKRVIGLLALLGLTATLAFAQPAKKASAIILRGAIIDNKCASAQARDQLGEFIKTHTKQCALMPACAASGYSLYTQGSLIGFDKDSDEKILAFLKKPESALKVVVTAERTGAELKLVSIENDPGEGK